MSLGSRVRGRGWICAVSLPKRWYGCRNEGFGLNFTNSFVAKQVYGQTIPVEAEKRGVKICP